MISPIFTTVVISFLCIMIYMKTTTNKFNTGDEKRLEEINQEFPAYRKVKVQEGFMQIFEQHLGVVESIEGDTYHVRYWELLIPAKLSDGLSEKPSVGSDVQFRWNHKGDSVITKVIRNLLEG